MKMEIHAQIAIRDLRIIPARCVKSSANRCLYSVFGASARLLDYFHLHGWGSG